MAFVAFVRGINVGGYRRFRPSTVASELKEYGVVSVGATGTFVVRKGSKDKFRAALAERLPFDAAITICEGRDLIRLEMENPFAAELPSKDVIWFVSVLPKAVRRSPAPCSIPSTGEWYVRIFGSKKQFVFGVYRRHMKTIGYLGQIDKLFGATVVTRNWNTIVTVARILKEKGE